MSKPFPVVPAVRLPLDVTIVARYVSGHYGLQGGVALTAILTAAGALVGGSRSMWWRDGVVGLNLQVVLVPGVVKESAGWLDFISAPLADEVTRLRSAAGDPKQLAAALGRSREALKSMAPDDPGKAGVVETFKRLGELALPYLHLSGFPRPHERDALGSALLSDATGSVLRIAIARFSEAELLRLVADDSNAEGQQLLSLLLVTPAEVVAGLKSGDLLPRWCPLVLPESGGVFAVPDVTKEAAVVTWAGIVKKLLAIRRTRSRHIVVTAAGEAVLNSAKLYTEDAASRLGQTKWFPWALSTCARLAGILHTINSDEDCDPAPDTWSDALRLTQWLIEVQARSVDGFGARLRGVKQKFHPARPDDMVRMKALMHARPTAKYRELVRYLPKRAPGHWKKCHLFITGYQSPQTPDQKKSVDAVTPCATPPTGPASPTCPTSDAP